MTVDDRITGVCYGLRAGNIKLQQLEPRRPVRLSFAQRINGLATTLQIPGSQNDKHIRVLFKNGCNRRQTNALVSASYQYTFDATPLRDR